MGRGGEFSLLFAFLFPGALTEGESRMKEKRLKAKHPAVIPYTFVHFASLRCLAPNG